MKYNKCNTLSATGLRVILRDRFRAVRRLKIPYSRRLRGRLAEIFLEDQPLQLEEIDLSWCWLGSAEGSCSDVVAVTKACPRLTRWVSASACAVG